MSSDDFDHHVMRGFAQATIETFRDMTGIVVLPRKGRALDESRPGDGIHAIIGFTGSVAGASVLSLPRSAACAVMTALLGEPVSTVDSGVIDGVQELINIIIGRARTHLATDGLDFSFGLPKTMDGVLFASDDGPDFTVLTMIFSSAELDEFALHLNWRRGNDAGV